SIEYSTESPIITVQSNIISSQVELHAKWGGVVPNLAAREHTKNIIPVLTEALETAHVTKDDIDLIAVTHAPGLIPALLSGVSVAKSLAYSWHKPLMGIHHIEGHIYANWIEQKKDIIFPVLALVVSGGHTQLVLMTDHCQYEIVGQTQDDAVGEAFDKVARILGLGYPGGPIISKRAQIFEQSKKENDITLPQPMKNSGDYNFSFSGIKTAVLYLVKNYRKENNLSDDTDLPQDFIDAVAHAFQTATVQILSKKTLGAVETYNARSVLLAGGVSANIQLREKLQQEITTNFSDVQFFAPKMEYCLDNAAMIGAAAHYRYNIIPQKEKDTLKDGWKTITAQPNCQLR
ncbi:MAG: tRNA (adenosine(37)-N6)-threonylcarbamoyltransferase complex transferase subunit TsaD, partial [Patescibacteria group bacterium]|nr:tRNA (adenosine(37)-N6)-threonylcarbamoyltransferase complex transferase subunit TsaD [Patescibacteria group bacterium]